MKLKNENGYVVTDITVAIIILLLFMSLISVLFFNITKNSKEIERESQATYIAMETIEAIKSKQYDDVELTNGEQEITKSGANYIYQGIENVVLLERDIKLETGYSSTIRIENYIPEKYKDEDSSNTDLIKIITVNVNYKLGGETKTVTLKTTISRQN